MLKQNQRVIGSAPCLALDERSMLIGILKLSFGRTYWERNIK